VFRDVGRAKPLAHNASKPSLQASRNTTSPGLIDVIVEMQRPTRVAQELGELTLAFLEGRSAQVLPAQLEQIETKQHGLRLSFNAKLVGHGQVEFLVGLF
jgi:hypothetical protein